MDSLGYLVPLGVGLSLGSWAQGLEGRGFQVLFRAAVDFLGFQG